MFASRPAVHPVEAPPVAEAAGNPPRVRMGDVQGMPGTTGGLLLRMLQFFFAVAALCVMATTNDFTSVTAFWYAIGFISCFGKFPILFSFVLKLEKVKLEE